LKPIYNPRELSVAKPGLDGLKDADGHNLEVSVSTGALAVELFEGEYFSPVLGGNQLRCRLAEFPAASAIALSRSGAST